MAKLSSEYEHGKEDASCFARDSRNWEYKRAVRVDAIAKHS